MSEYFKGVTFANQHLSPADDAVIRRRLIADGVLTGCEISHSRDTLSMAPGYLMACGREILHPSAENWTVTYSPATSKTASGTVIALSDASSGPLNGLRIYGRTTQDGTPTPDNPVELVSVGDGGSVGVTVVGKNILDLSKMPSTKSGDGVTYTKNADGSYSRAGTATDIYGNIWLLGGWKTTSDGAIFTLLPGKTYYIKDCILFFCEVNTSIGPGSYTVDSRKYPDGIKIGGVRNAFLEIGVTYNDIVYPMASLIDTEWEGIVPRQTLPISTPNGLPGIPVKSGGNYTDADGQQWICDEVDLARGVYVQRVATITFDGGDDEKWTIQNETDATILFRSDRVLNSNIENYTSSYITNVSLPDTTTSNTGTIGSYVFGDTFRIRMPKTIVSTLDEFLAWVSVNNIVFLGTVEPTETPIPEAELAAYAALHTNRPNTTVYNDAGAHMEVGYYPQDDAIPSNGYARTLLTVDLTRTAAADVFDQVNTSIEYADTEDGFPAPVQDDINSEGSVYQLPLAVVSIEDGAITGITDSIGNAEPI